MSNTAATPSSNGDAHIEKRTRNAEAVVRYRDRRRQHIEELKQQNAELQSQLDQAKHLIQQLQQAAAATTDEKLVQTTQKVIQLGLDCHLLKTENEHLRQLARQSALHAILASGAPPTSSATTSPKKPPYAYMPTPMTVPYVADASDFATLTSTAPANTRLRKRRRSSTELDQQDVRFSSRCTETPETHPPATPVDFASLSHATLLSDPATTTTVSEDGSNFFLPLPALSSLIPSQPTTAAAATTERPAHAQQPSDLLQSMMKTEKEELFDHVDAWFSLP